MRGKNEAWTQGKGNRARGGSKLGRGVAGMSPTDMGKRREGARMFSGRRGSYPRPLGLLFHVGQKESTGEKGGGPQLNPRAIVVSTLKRESSKA